MIESHEFIGHSVCLYLPLTFRFPSELKPDPSSLLIASLRFLTSSEGVFCFDLKMKFILIYDVCECESVCVL